MAWIPITFILDNGHKKFFRLFYLIKVIRIKRAFKAFDIRAMLIKIKDFTKRKMKEKIKDDPLLAEDTIADHNNVNLLMNIKYCIFYILLFITVDFKR